MSVLVIDVTDKLKVIVDDGPYDPHVVIAQPGERVRIEGPDVADLAAVLTGATVMVRDELPVDWPSQTLR